MKPFFILELAVDADDAAIEAAYRRNVLKYPPDSCPEQFKQISQAYESIKTLDRRITYLMNLENHHSTTESMSEELLAVLRLNPMATHLDERQFYQFLKI